VVIALGTHRPMTEAKVIAKVGPTITREFEIVNVSC
jgi:nickel-dependent lactate racemase